MNTIIIYRLGSLGDTMVALPCFNAIAKLFHNSKRICVTNAPVSDKAPSLKSILVPGGLIHGVIEYKVGLRNIPAIISLALKIRNTGAKTLVYLPSNRTFLSIKRDMFFFYLCGIRQFIGFSSHNNHNFLKSTPDPLNYESANLARSIEDVVGKINLDSKDSWFLGLTAEEIKKSNEALLALNGNEFFVINMGGKVSVKDWGIDNWSALILQLGILLPNLGLCIVGSRDDFKRADQVLSIWPNQRLNLCGVIEPRVSAGVLVKACFFIGHDSGPMHLAAAMGTPCICLFGNYNKPKKWHPYGKLHRVIHDMNGIEYITVERVLSEVEYVNALGFSWLDNKVD